MNIIDNKILGESREKPTWMDLLRSYLQVWQVLDAAGFTVYLTLDKCLGVDDPDPAPGEESFVRIEFTNPATFEEFVRAEEIEEYYKLKGGPSRYLANLWLSSSEPDDVSLKKFHQVLEPLISSEKPGIRPLEKPLCPIVDMEVQPGYDCIAFVPFGTFFERPPIMALSVHLKSANPLPPPPMFTMAELRQMHCQ